MPLLIKVPRTKDSASYPAMLNVLNRRQTAVQRALRRTGLAGYEPMTQAALLALADRAPQEFAFYDIGAHIGLYAALIDTVFYAKQPRTYAFEPTPEIAQVAQSLARSNELTFSVIEAALSDGEGMATLYLSDKSETSNSLNSDFRQHAHAVEVRLTTVDAFADQVHVDPYVLKIDVETHEPAVLRGAMATIERARPWIVCEILRDGDHDAVGKVLHDLAALGYAFHPLTDRFPWPTARPGDLRLMTGLGARDWLLAPSAVDKGLTDDVARWLVAIGQCDQTTNCLVDAGQPLPDGWNAAPAAKRAVIPSQRGLLDRVTRRAGR